MRLRMIVYLSLVMCLASLPVMGEEEVKGVGKTITVVEVPDLLRAIQGESETDKFNRMVQFIKKTNPKPFIGSPAAPRPELPFCRQFMDDLISMRQVKAIEADFVTGYDKEVAEKEVTEKLNLKHCEDIEHYSIIPPDANPMLYRRGTLGFNYVSELGGPPYRIYRIQLGPDKKSKYPILYYNAPEFFDKKYGTLSSGHTGFARLDLKKCEIDDEKGASSEISTSFQIGRNVLVRYKGNVFAFTLDYDRRYPTSYSRLELRRLGIPITKGVGDCLWTIIQDYKEEEEKSSKANNQQ